MADDPAIAGRSLALQVLLNEPLGEIAITLENLIKITADTPHSAEV